MSNAKDTIDEETVGLGVDAALMLTITNNFNGLLQISKDLILKLKQKDNELGLHTLAPSKVKENIVYPNKFSGKAGENIHNICQYSSIRLGLPVTSVDSEAIYSYVNIIYITVQMRIRQSHNIYIIYLG